MMLAAIEMSRTFCFMMQNVIYRCSRSRSRSRPICLHVRLNWYKLLGTDCWFLMIMQPGVVVGIRRRLRTPLNYLAMHLENSRLIATGEVSPFRPPQ